jgi:glycosyltransferase involved in cell wall biosynthesis
MSDLLEIQDQLEALYARKPFHLDVVSNDRRLFDLLFADRKFSAGFVGWSEKVCSERIQQASVCLLPNPKNVFSMAKSVNRICLSLSLGTPVVCSSYPGSDSFKDGVLYENWLENIEKCLDNKKFAEDLVGKGRRIIEENFSSKVVREKWRQEVLS